MWPCNDNFRLVRAKLGIFIVDWNIVTFNGDPLVLPLFNIMNGIVGMALTGLMIIGLYWSNTWNTAYLPINSNRTFDRFGGRYNISRSIDDRGHFSKEEYEAYSPAYMAAGNITVSSGKSSLQNTAGGLPLSVPSIHPFFSLATIHLPP